ncbi:dienelactone hydrolase family protein [Sorangium sp. So ce448]|uniref:dienelactone hydrolase family protein n=1 Tax=Sorangium sp. So ce448 TaxID=3133314 RepID=UPI003F61538E
MSRATATLRTRDGHQQKQRLIGALQQAGVQHAVETYEGAKHGWVPSDSAVYNQAASERHYQTLLALFDATLKWEAGRDHPQPRRRSQGRAPAAPRRAPARLGTERTTCSYVNT